MKTIHPTLRVANRFAVLVCLWVAASGCQTASSSARVGSRGAKPWARLSAMTAKKKSLLAPVKTRPREQGAAFAEILVVEDDGRAPGEGSTSRSSHARSGEPESYFTEGEVAEKETRRADDSPPIPRLFENVALVSATAIEGNMVTGSGPPEGLRVTEAGEAENGESWTGLPDSGVTEESSSTVTGDGDEHVGTPVVVEPLISGVDPDRRGLYDNLIGRLGGVWYDNSLNSEWGFLGTGETTHQWGESNLFSHLGVVGTMFEGHSGSGVSVGLSRLAKIVGTRVERPWILGFAYDGYYDSGIFGTNSDLYVDQMRGLVGYALCPRWDVGVWGAGSLTGGDITLPSALAAGPTTRYRSSLGDRIAGYSSWHWGQTGIFNITSVGYQENQGGNFFVESDCYVPLTGAVNLFVGGGYSDNLGGSSDLGLGLEFTWGRTGVARSLSHHFRGKSLPRVGMLPSEKLPHGSFVRAIDPASIRYRGGWANDTYRSVFRVESPTRLTKRLDLEALPSAVLPQPGGNGTVVDPGPQGGVVCPKPSNPLEVRVPRRTDRPTRPSRLSNLQKGSSLRS